MVGQLEAEAEAALHDEDASILDGNVEALAGVIRELVEHTSGAFSEVVGYQRMQVGHRQADLQLRAGPRDPQQHLAADVGVEAVLEGGEDEARLAHDLQQDIPRAQQLFGLRFGQEAVDHEHAFRTPAVARSTGRERRRRGAGLRRVGGAAARGPVGLEGVPLLILGEAQAAKHVEWLEQELRHQRSARRPRSLAAVLAQPLQHVDHSVEGQVVRTGRLAGPAGVQRHTSAGAVEHRRPGRAARGVGTRAGVEGVLVLVVSVVVFGRVSIHARNRRGKNLDLLGVVVADDEHLHPHAQALRQQRDLPRRGESQLPRVELEQPKIVHGIPVNRVYRQLLMLVKGGQGPNRAGADYVAVRED
mmetsp:Transcript_41654/g.120264  ORF Transcript_41654/g.120264 Transcript_41654/m.120264 type:complete len:360 (-) Transcript_41654:409-1488(-)